MGSLGGWPNRKGLGNTLAALIVILVIVVAGMVAIYFMGQSPDGHQVKYIADVQSSSLGQQTSYNLVNLIKDSALLAGASLAVGACATETLGACLASVPIIGDIAGPALNDDIVDTTAIFQLTNLGNGTASNVEYDIQVYSDGTLIQTEHFGLSAPLSPGQTVDIPFTFSLKFGGIPIAIWNWVQNKGEISIHLSDLSYQGGA